MVNTCPWVHTYPCRVHTFPISNRFVLIQEINQKKERGNISLLIHRTYCITRHTVSLCLCIFVHTRIHYMFIRTTHVRFTLCTPRIYLSCMTCTMFSKICKTNYAMCMPVGCIRCKQLRIKTFPQEHIYYLRIK